MSDVNFGKQLRIFRQQCHDLKSGKPISQQKFGQLLGEEMGDFGFSGAAVSDWERRKSSISANDRLVLISLIKILKKYAGIKNLADANLLLEAGNYRALNNVERNEIFPEEMREAAHQPSTRLPEKQTPRSNSFMGSIFFNSPAEYQALLDEANKGPAPAWPRMMVLVIRKTTDRWSILHVLKTLVWVWIWVLTYLLMIPSLRFPFSTDENAMQAMVLYAIGAIILPPVIGATANTKDKAFWREQKVSNAPTTRLYVHQGAYVGFHLGYFILFPLALIQSQFHIQPILWLEFMKMIVPIAISYASAQLVPYNLWRAYGRLRLKDGAVFFVFTFLGPLWAWFFVEFHKSIELFALLMSATFLAVAMAIQYQRKGNTIIPVHWIIIFCGLIVLCQITLLFIQ